MSAPRFTLRQLRLFTSAARHPSLAAACRTLNLSQATLSEALRDLEAALGLTLFDRQGRRLRLNPTGRGFLIDVERLLGEADDMARRYGGGGRLTIGASVTVGNYMLGDILDALRRRRPGIGLSVVIRNTQEMAQAVLARQVDVALVEGAVGHPDLQVRDWRRDPLVVIAAPDHPLAAGATVEDLADAEWVLREVGSGARENFDAAAKAWPRPARVAMEVGGNELLKSIVRSGAALGCLSESAVRGEVRRRELAIVPTGSFAMIRTIRIVTPAGVGPSEAVAAFLEACGP